MSTEPRQLGKYELRERLARGGQGEVWKAFDTQLRRFVAIKQLHTNVQSDPDFTSRFEREARFIASLHHPNIVQIHDFQLVYAPDSDSTTAYMVMDYIEGPTLADYIRNTSRKGQFPTAADIVYIFTAVSLALDYAHEKGMIHRDIKPANIILDQRLPKRNTLGTPILTDFGIAKLQGVSADTTKALGTPLYVSPEQAQGLAGDKRSDLYSLGIILYEMITGVTPFRGDSVMAILMQHFQELPTPPAQINPHIPPTLSVVMLKSIAKEPDERFSSATAMTIAVAESFNVAIPAELIKRNAMPDIDGASSYNPLQPSQPLGMTPASLTPISLQTSSPPIISLPSAFTPPANGRQTPLTAPADSRPGSLLSPNAGKNTPPGVVAPGLGQPGRQAGLGQPERQVGLEQPERQAGLGQPERQVGLGQPERQVGLEQPGQGQALPLHFGVGAGLAPALKPRSGLALLALILIAALVVGSGLLYAFFALNRTATPSPSSSNTVIGHVRFLSSPNASQGSLDEVEITMQQIPAAPAGERYYAWLQINSESLLPINWPLTTQNGRLSSPTYIHPLLLKNKPYLFLITLEKANTAPQVATLAPGARLYYAILPATIQHPASFDIRPCPQDGTSNICMS